MAFSLTDLLLGNQYTGIEHFSCQKQDMSAFVLVQKRKNELEITRKEHGKSEVTPLDWPKNLPAYLVINTGNVIHKEIEGTGLSDEKILHKAFPGLQHEEFHYEIWRLDSRCIIAISRRSYLEEIVSGYLDRGFLIAGVSLGISSVSGLTTYLHEDLIHTNSQQVSLSGQGQVIQPGAVQEKTYEINGISIGNHYVLAFAGILRLLVNSGQNSGSITGYNDGILDDFNQQRFFSKGFKAIIGFLLLLLLANFFVFSYYFRKDQEISESISVNNSITQSIGKSKERIKIQETKLKNILEFNNSNTAFMVNEIARMLPPQVLLSEFTYNPLEKKIKAEEPVRFLEKNILISGTTADNTAFTQWIEKLQRLEWVTQAVIVNFGKNESAETVFTIKLILK